MRILPILSALLGLASWSGQAFAQEQAAPSSTGFSGSLAVATDYHFRGLSLSDGKPALQGGVEYADRSGFVGGAWASTLADTSGPDVELDLYAGFTGEAAGLSYTLKGLAYLYPGQQGMSYVELDSSVSAPVGALTLGAELAYTPAQKNAVRNLYTAVTGEIDGPYEVTLSSRIGYENGAYDRKWDWEIGIARELGPLTLQAAYVATNRRRDVATEGKPTLLAMASVNF